jgi:hypothetical protein
LNQTYQKNYPLGAFPSGKLLFLNKIKEQQMFLSASQIFSLFILPCKILYFAAKTTLNITFLIIKSIIKITIFLKARPAKK